MDRSCRRRMILVCGLLGALTLGAFWPTLNNGFVLYDDPVYVTQNPPVLAGLSSSSITWAWRTGHGGNWHPLTWLSHMADVQLFGLNPLGHHFSSLLLHVANVCLLFVVLNGLTGALWRSVLVAALFGLHPLRVESVAWVAESKDVLIGLFFLLTLWAYTRYVFDSPKSKVQSPKSKVQSPQPTNSLKNERTTRNTRHAGRYYFLALICFALGLLSKPM